MSMVGGMATMGLRESTITAIMEVTLIGEVEIMGTGMILTGGDEGIKITLIILRKTFPTGTTKCFQTI